jgi:hypothetical protein
MDPEEKEEKTECQTRNVMETGGRNQTIEHAEKGKTSTNNSQKSLELP